MELEEAGEIILLGPYLTCPACNGTGGTSEPGDDGTGLYITGCAPCLSAGLIMRPGYNLAAMMLDLPIRWVQPGVLKDMTVTQNMEDPTMVDVKYTFEVPAELTMIRLKLDI